MNKFSLKKLILSFTYAFEGLAKVILTGQNISVHIVAAFVAIVLGFVLKISKLEFVAILLCIAVVIALEIMNTAIEKLCDFICSDYNRDIKAIKDIAASAVLVAAIVSVIIAAIIFIPKL